MSSKRPSHTEVVIPHLLCHEQDGVEGGVKKAEKDFLGEKISGIGAEAQRGDLQREDEKSQLSLGSHKRFQAGQAYDYRNVYKSVIRHMYNLTKRAKKKLRDSLKSQGFEDQKIKIAFETIRQYRPPDRPKDIERKSQYRVEQILKSKTIFTYILRETLVFMLDKWKNGKFGQLYKANSLLYIEGSEKLLNEVEEILQ